MMPPYDWFAVQDGETGAIKRLGNSSPEDVLLQAQPGEKLTLITVDDETHELRVVPLKVS